MAAWGRRRRGIVCEDVELKVVLSTSSNRHTMKLQVNCFPQFRFLTRTPGNEGGGDGNEWLYYSSAGPGLHPDENHFTGFHAN